MTPVAWMTDKNQIVSNSEKEKYEITYGDFCIPLYTAPRDLSDEEIKQVIDNISHYGSIAKDDYVSFARAILKKASEK